MVVVFILKATGNDELWGVARISYFLVIFYYYGLSNAEREIGKGMSQRQLPPFIKCLLFLNAPNRFTLCTIIYQSIVVIMTLVSLILVFLLKMESDFVSTIYAFSGFLFIFITTIFWNITSKRY